MCTTKEKNEDTFEFPEFMEPGKLIHVTSEDIKPGDALGESGWYITETHELKIRYHKKFLALYNDVASDKSTVAQEVAHWRLWSFCNKALKLDPYKSWSFRMQAGHKIIVFSRGYIKDHKPEAKADPEDMLAAMRAMGISGADLEGKPMQIHGIG
jgi:hypothetical protein